MFDQVGVPNVDVYEGTTGVYMGKSTFHLTPDAEQAFLQIINGMGIPETILLQDVDFFQTSSLYTPPDVYEKYQQIGVVHAEFRDSESGLWIPADIYMRYEAQTSGNSFNNNKYHFDSVVYSNIDVEDVKFIPHGTYFS